MNIIIIPCDTTRNTVMKFSTGKHARLQYAHQWLEKTATDWLEPRPQMRTAVEPGLELQCVCKMARGTKPSLRDFRSEILLRSTDTQAKTHVAIIYHHKNFVLSTWTVQISPAPLSRPSKPHCPITCRTNRKQKQWDGNPNCPASPVRL